MAADQHIQIGHDTQGNILVTGDDNRVYVFPGITELTPEILAQLQSGVHTMQDAPGAVPLPLLTLRISSHDTASTTWTVTSVYPEGNSVRHNSCRGGLRRGQYTIESYATRTGAALSFKTERHRHGTLPTALAVRGDLPRVQIFSSAGPAL